MDAPPRVECRYHPVHCRLLNQPVWAIMTKQPDGSWRIVNCLDKAEGCFRLPCAFTTDAGEWPYDRGPAAVNESA
jgi:hypothetical protein